MIVHNLAPPILVNRFRLVEEVSAMPTRAAQCGNLYMPMCRLQRTEHSFMIRGTTVWNSISDDVRVAPSLIIFKNWMMILPWNLNWRMCVYNRYRHGVAVEYLAVMNEGGVITSCDQYAGWDLVTMQWPDETLSATHLLYYLLLLLIIMLYVCLLTPIRRYWQSISCIIRIFCK